MIPYSVMSWPSESPLLLVLFSSPFQEVRGSIPFDSASWKPVPEKSVPIPVLRKRLRFRFAENHIKIYVHMHIENYIGKHIKINVKIHIKIQIKSLIKNHVEIHIKIHIKIHIYISNIHHCALGAVGCLFCKLLVLLVLCLLFFLGLQHPKKFLLLWSSYDFIGLLFEFISFSKELEDFFNF